MSSQTRRRLEDLAEIRLGFKHAAVAGDASLVWHPAERLADHLMETLNIHPSAEAAGVLTGPTSRRSRRLSMPRSLHPQDHSPNGQGSLEIAVYGIEVDQDAGADKCVDHARRPAQHTQTDAGTYPLQFECIAAEASVEIVDDDLQPVGGPKENRPGSATRCS